MKYTYKTIIDKKSNSIRYRCWEEIFPDGYILNRMKPIKINGEKITWYPMRVLQKMTNKQLEGIKIDL